MSDVEIPVIDLAGLMEGEVARSRIVAEIARACEQWGFFQVSTATIFSCFLNSANNYDHWWIGSGIISSHMFSNCDE